MNNLSAEDRKNYIEVLLALSGFGAMETENKKEQNIVHGFVHENTESIINTSTIQQGD